MLLVALFSPVSPIVSNSQYPTPKRLYFILFDLRLQYKVSVLRLKETSRSDVDRLRFLLKTRIIKLIVIFYWLECIPFNPFIFKGHTAFFKIENSCIKLFFIYLKLPIFPVKFACITFKRTDKGNSFLQKKRKQWYRTWRPIYLIFFKIDYLFDLFEHFVSLLDATVINVKPLVICNWKLLSTLQFLKK